MDSASPQLVRTWTTKPRASRGAVGSAPSGPRYEVRGQSDTGGSTHNCTVPYSTRHVAPRGPILTGWLVYTPVRASAIVPRAVSSPWGGCKIPCICTSVFHSVLHRSFSRAPPGRAWATLYGSHET